MIKFNTIKSPIITEKASILKDKFNKYSLYVFTNANKYKIKLFIESFFNVEVSSINTIRIKSKLRRFKGVVGFEKEKKKVYFSLKRNQKLDIMNI